jgi:hypothetical protein
MRRAKEIEKHYRVGELADLLGMHRNSISKMIRERRIWPVRRMGRNATLIPVSSVQTLLIKSGRRPKATTLDISARSSVQIPPGMTRLNGSIDSAAFVEFFIQAKREDADWLSAKKAPRFRLG